MKDETLQRANRLKESIKSVEEEIKVYETAFNNVKRITIHYNDRNPVSTMELKPSYDELDVLKEIARERIKFFRDKKDKLEAEFDSL